MKRLFEKYTDVTAVQSYRKQELEQHSVLGGMIHVQKFIYALNALKFVRFVALGIMMDILILLGNIKIVVQSVQMKRKKKRQKSQKSQKRKRMRLDYSERFTEILSFDIEMSREIFYKEKDYLL